MSVFILSGNSQSFYSFLSLIGLTVGCVQDNYNNMTLLFTYRIVQYYKSLSYKMHLSEIKGFHDQLRAFARAPEKLQSRLLSQHISWYFTIL